jgi:FecR protein
MAYRSAEDNGIGANATPSRRESPVDRVALLASAPVVGKLLRASGSVTITRGNGVVAEPAAGDAVYLGDAIETGADGGVAIAFTDGTTFNLSADAHLVLDEFSFQAGRSANSALFRAVKGVFSVIAGKMAAGGRLVIDTPLGQIRNAAPAAGFGGLVFSLFTIGLIHELKAASADIGLLDDGAIDCKDLKHGGSLSSTIPA